MTEAEEKDKICLIDSNIWLYAFIETQDVNKSKKAKYAAADILYSEDMQDGFILEETTIVNPFK